MIRMAGKRKRESGDHGKVTGAVPQSKKVRKHSANEAKVNKNHGRKSTSPKTDRKLDTQLVKKSFNKPGSENNNKILISKPNQICVAKQSQQKQKIKHKHSVPDKILVDKDKEKHKYKKGQNQTSQSDKRPSGADSSSKQDEAGSIKEVKTPLTDRQKHKRFKLRMKRKVKMKRKVTETVKKEATVQVQEKRMVPRGTDKAIANWNKLQEVLEKQREKTNADRLEQGKAPLKGPHRSRNPKFSKVEAWKKGNKGPITEAKVAEDKSPEIWFDDVDDIYLDKEPAGKSESSSKNDKAVVNPLVKPEAYKGVTRVLGMDCEMVGVGDGSDDMLARVSVVNQYGEAIYDKFVRPRERVVDYRTFVSGVRPEDLQTGEAFMVVQKAVADMLKGRILVGHAIHNDLKVLYLDHPRKLIRDTSRYKLFRSLFQGRTPSLKKLSEKVLAVRVQEGEHNSIQDAQAAMRLYTMYRKQWEAEIKQTFKRIKKPRSAGITGQKNNEPSS